MKLMLIDVDYTLYPRGTGPFPYVNENIDRYVMSRCGVGLKKAQAVRRRYIGLYGSTLGGLMKDHGVDPGHYLKAVHDVPVEDLLVRDERLQKVLAGMRGGMVVFSNGSSGYVRRILEALGVSSLFEDLFTIEFMDFIPKPRVYPFRKVMELYGRKPGDCVLVDDRPANVRTALDMGMSAVFVGNDGSLPGALTVPDIYSVAEVVY